MRKNSERGKHRTERCKDLGGDFTCMGCVMRSKKDKILGTDHGFKWKGKEIHKILKTWSNSDLQRLVHTTGKNAVWCRTWSGSSRVKLRRSCSTLASPIGKETKRTHVETNQKIEGRARARRKIVENRENKKRVSQGKSFKGRRTSFTTPAPWHKEESGT